MITIKEIAWLAGIIEGEGTFRINDDGTNPIIKIAMTDIDVVIKCSNILGTKVKSYEKKDNIRKTVHVTITYGTKFIEWMQTIYCLMGIRRRAKIKGILLKWLSYESKPRILKNKCNRGHILSEENTYINKIGYRRCRECFKIWDYERGRHSNQNTLAFKTYEMYKKLREQGKVG